jgi:hypothetical protein
MTYRKNSGFYGNLFKGLVTIGSSQFRFLFWVLNILRRVSPSWYKHYVVWNGVFFYNNVMTWWLLNLAAWEVSLWEMFWTDPKDLWPINLGPISPKAQTLRLETLLATYLLTARGVHEANETGSKEFQRLFAHVARSRNKLPGGYTSHDFVTARARCATTTALQPSTSINRGLNAVPKVDLSLPQKPSLSESLLTWASECLQVHTPHSLQQAFHRILPP